MLAVLLCLAMPSAAAAKPFKVGNGQNGGIAIDDAGTVYVGWQINIYEPGDAVQFCVLPPKTDALRGRARRGLPRPGLQPLTRLGAAARPRTSSTSSSRAPTAAAPTPILARSVDGGRTFGPAVQISARPVLRGGPGPRTAASRSSTARPPRAPACSRPTARAPAPRAAQLGPYLEGVFTDIAASGRRCSPSAPTPASHARVPAPRRRATPTTPPRGSRSTRASGREPEVGGPARRLRGDARADRHAEQQPVRAAPRGHGLVAARRRLRPRSATTGFAAHEQRPRPPDRAHHLLGLPPGSTRRRPTAASSGPRSSRSATSAEYLDGSRSRPTPAAPAPR